MAARLVVTAAAEADLDEAWTWVATRGGVSAADALVDGILATCRLLAVNPLAGRARPELAAEVRSHPIGRHVALYRPFEDGIAVLRVVHGARDIGAGLLRT